MVVAACLSASLAAHATGGQGPASRRFAERPDLPPSVEAFKQGLRDLGWVEGQNIAIDYRLAEGRVDRLPDLAAELVRLKVDVIAAGPTPSAMAKNATRTIPVVMLGAAEPVKLGLIASFARPGGTSPGCPGA